MEVFQNANIATLFRMLDKPSRFSEKIPKRTQEHAIIILERPGQCVFRIRAEDGEYRWLSVTQLYLRDRNDFPTMDIIDSAPEIMSYLYLSALKDGINFKAANFPVLHSCNIVEDSFPFQMLPYWKNSEVMWLKTDSKNHEFLPDPYNRQQMFLLVETKDCGEALQPSKILPHVWQCVSILLQVSLAMAVAESALEFEHRDLRLNNLYLQDSESNYLEYIFSGEKYWLRTFGVRVCITGFTMARISYDDVVYYARVKNGGSWSGNFQVERHDEDNLHRSINKYCKENATPRRNARNETQPDTQIEKDNWASFQPYTNIVCLRHIFEQMCELLLNYRPKFQETMSGIGDPSKKDEAFMLLNKWRDEIASYESAACFIQDNICLCKQMNLIK